VQSVFRGPPEMLEQLISYYAIWAEICRHLDPTRQWISADGDGDGVGKLPVTMVHYGGAEAMSNAAKAGKPWGVGEASGAYYATPEQVAKTNGERAYESFEGRMEGIAIDAYEDLLLQKELHANYRSVFNLVWYGLQPLPLGMPDTSHPPTLADGIFFPSYIEGKPGVQPERLGPYSTTLNPGYDPSLPLYKTWPLFDAIKDANSDPTVVLPWSATVSGVETSGAKPSSARVSTVRSVGILAGSDSKLPDQLSQAGIPTNIVTMNGTPEILFVDGRNPPAATGRQEIDNVLKAGGTVFVWGVAKASLPALNLLFPMPLEITDRKSSSLIRVQSSSLTSGLRLSDLYFSELTPPIILDGGLSGPLIAGSTILLEASNTDWLKWNKEAEYAKTGMIVRSERETKPSGVAMAEISQGPGRLIVCNLPAWSHLYKSQLLIRHLLENLDIPLSPQVDVGEPFLKTGRLVRALGAGRFSSADGGTSKAYVSPVNGDVVREGNRIENLRWVGLSANTSGEFQFGGLPLSGGTSGGVVYLSLWIQSPRSLDNLLLEPDMPKVDLDFETTDSLELFLNGKSVATHAEHGTVKADSGLGLQQGWNHILIRLVHTSGEEGLSASLVSSDLEFLSQLHSALQKP
jgi:hypothetical protein